MRKIRKIELITSRGRDSNFIRSFIPRFFDDSLEISCKKCVKNLEENITH